MCDYAEKASKSKKAKINNAQKEKINVISPSDTSCGSLGALLVI